jgi:hypothetical protein
MLPAALLGLWGLKPIDLYHKYQIVAGETASGLSIQK